MENTDLNWRKSSYSSNGGATCVEAADTAGRVLVRDTAQHGTGPTLSFTAHAWCRLTSQIKAGSR